MKAGKLSGAAADACFAHAETVFSQMQQQGARVPGERRYQARAESQSGRIALDASVYAELVALAGG